MDILNFNAHHSSKIIDHNDKSKHVYSNEHCVPTNCKDGIRNKVELT